MPFIEVIPPESAEGALREVYTEVAGRRGRVAEVMRIHSLLPETMRSHLRFYLDIVYGHGPLSRLERELVAVVTSRANGCDYCVVHHKEALARHLKDARLVGQIAEDWTKAASLDERQQALCLHAVRLTQAPGQVQEDDIDRLRAVGLDDAGILHVTLVIGYFNFVNRMVMGLGVPLEGEAERTGYKY